MRIRRKVILAVAITLLVMFGVAYFAAGRVVDASLHDVEHKLTVDASARVQQAIARDLESIANFNEDWATWDDTYQFMADQNETYLESNLPAVALETFNVHAMLFVDSTGEVILGFAMDPETSRGASLPAGLAVVAGSEAMQHESANSAIDGIVMLDDGPAMITSYPIVTSLGEGPTRGALIMMRWLDDGTIAQLSEVTGYEMVVTPLGSEIADQDVVEELSNAELAIRPRPDKFISAVSYLDDINGQPVLLLEVTREMEFVGQDGDALRYFTVAFVVGAVVLGVVLTVMLDRTVLRRLVGLRNSVTVFIQRGGPHGERFPVSGRDELSELGASLNDMLDVLERTEAELREATDHLGARTKEVASVNSRLRTELEERKLLEGRLEVAEKLEALGVLAGGIAHDFNNLLVGILANASLLGTKFVPGTPEHEQVQRLNYAAQQATGLTSQLLTFAQGGDPILQPSSVEEILIPAASFALGETGATWSFKPETDVAAVNVDRGQVGQVLHNLLINAAQAMPEGGAIEVAARQVVVVERDTTRGLLPGEYVLLSITDGGPGIPTEHIDRIFDPYFSTKADGSGLGLATAWSIARRHGGALSVGSSSSTHTTMELYLPVAHTTAAYSPRSSKPVGHQTARVLVVDDNEMILESVESLLIALGYRSASALNGESALEMYKRASGALDPFDAVIVDVTMPGGMDGAETIAALIGIDPQVVAVVSSGYSNSRVLTDFRSHGFKAVLPKPFTIAQVAETLDEVLVAPSRAGAGFREQGSIETSGGGPLPV